MHPLPTKVKNKRMVLLPLLLWSVVTLGHERFHQSACAAYRVFPREIFSTAWFDPIIYYARPVLDTKFLLLFQATLLLKLVSEVRPLFQKEIQFNVNT